MNVETILKGILFDKMYTIIGIPLIRPLMTHNVLDDGPLKLNIYDNNSKLNIFSRFDYNVNDKLNIFHIKVSKNDYNAQSCS